ncbi:MAG: hypothetical protein GVY36_05980 [Verrucomicrobia bacterium]|nr:hypothetical protein [Verrucomicrobiota bacterium]
MPEPTPFEDVLGPHPVDPAGFTPLADVFPSRLQHVHPVNPVGSLNEAASRQLVSGWVNWWFS